MHCSVVVKGRVGDFGEASISKLALKTWDPTLAATHSPKPCLHQNILTRTAQADQSLTSDMMRDMMRNASLNDSVMNLSDLVDPAMTVNGAEKQI